MQSPKRRSLNLSSSGGSASTATATPASSLSPAASRLSNPFRFLSASMSPGLPNVDENLYYVRKGTNGFDEMKRYIKQGNDMCKELSAILVERGDLELHYSRSLVKISQRIAKVAATCTGTVAASWGSIAESIKREAEIRQEFAVNLSDEVTRPMKELNESFHKSRKPIEVQVEKSIRILLDKRSEEAVAKKKAYSSAKETEKAWDALSDARIGRKGSGSGGGGSGDSRAEKDANKQEKKCRACQTNMLKCDREYYDSCLRAELARLDWEATVAKGSEQLQSLEADRLHQTHEMLQKYQRRVDHLAPAYAQLSGRLQQCLALTDIDADIGTVVEQRGALLHSSEQLLFESYAEDLNNPMDRARRELALRSYTGLICSDIEREVKGREGVEKLLHVYSTSPGFSEATSHQEAAEKLAHIQATLQFLEASRYKQDLALHALSGSPPPERPTYRLAHCLERSKDRLGMPQTVLRLPPVLRRAPSVQSAASSAASAARGQADGRPNPPGGAAAAASAVTADFETESAASQAPEEEAEEEEDGDPEDPTYAQLDPPPSSASSASVAPPPPPPPPPPPGAGGDNGVRVCGWARVLYDYAAGGGGGGGRDEELSLHEGDVVSVLEKCPDGWWLGEDSAGRRGIFPGAYAEDF